MTALTKFLALFETRALLCALACFAVTLDLATTATAQSSINECEKIQAADAYNQCLAKFGPPAKSGNLEPERPGDIKSNSEEAAATGGRPSRVKAHGTGRRRGHAIARRGRGGHGSHGRGRKRMTISIGK